MKNTCLNFMLLCLCIAVTQQSLSQNKITLKPYEDKSQSGYQSIVFEYEERTAGAPGQPAQVRKERKEFDIEANNPYNKLNLEVKKAKPGGAKTFKIKDKNELQSVEGIKNYPSGKPLPVLAGSHWFLDIKEKNAAIAYILFLYGPNGGVASERTSVIKVLDHKGRVSHQLENLPFDVYSIEISNNGRYLFYAYGEYIEDSEEVEERGFKIIDLKNNTVFYESLNTTVMGFFKHPNEISFRTSEASGRYVYLFNELSSKLYRVDDSRVVRYLNFMTNLSVEGDTLTTSDYQLVK